MTKPTFDFDLIVIGSGAGGSAAATITAREGHKVAIIEANLFGGESPNYGDVPRNALLHAAQVYDDAKTATNLGIRSATIGYNYPTLQQWKALAIKRTGASNNRNFYENQNVTTISGEARFVSPYEITVNRRHYSASKFLIATGAHYAKPAITNLEETGYQTPRTILNLTRPPKRLYVIGGGEVALEIAEMMAIFGTQVYIAEIASRLLPEKDSEVGELVEKTLKDQKGIISLTQTRTLSIIKEGLNKKITYTRGGVEKTVRVDEVLVAIGRVPSVDLGLENAGVEFTPKGIEVNDYLQTSVKHIYAAGDVLGESSETHTALLQSRIVAHNLFKKNRLIPDYKAIPKLVFTSPMVATVGLNADDCRRRDLEIKSAIAPLSMIPRSNTANFNAGFVKIISDKKGTILGATIVSPGAGEMIHELSLAISHGLTASDLADSPHAFLSWSEAIRIAAKKLA